MRSKDEIETPVAPTQFGSSGSISTTPPPVTADIAPVSSMQERLLDLGRRNAMSLATGQTAATTTSTPPASQECVLPKDTITVNAVNSPATVAQVLSSGGTILGGDAAMPSLPSCKLDQACSRMLAQGFPLLTDSQTIVQEPEKESELSPKSKEKGKKREARDGNGKGKMAGNNTFPSLSRASPAAIEEAQDLSRYMIDAPTLPNEVDPPESFSSKDKGKGKAVDASPVTTIPQVKSPETANRKSTSSSFATKKIAASVERRVANYTTTHAAGWFDELPPINEELFNDSPHKEYKMVLIHTARCGVCLQYNKGTLFMCAACTVSICERCADVKCGVVDADAAKDAPGDDDVVMEGTEVGKAAEDCKARKLDWCGPYHEAFRGAYHEWKAGGGKEGTFASTGGVEFKAGGGKPGGRKRKAT